MTSPPRHHPQEAGSVTPLIVGYTLILLVLIGVVASASAVFLRQRALAAAADGAALAATRALDAAAVRSVALAPSDAIPLDSGDAAAAVAAYLSATDAAARFPGLAIADVSVDGGATVHVTLQSRVHLPLVASLAPDMVSISASAVAEGVVLPPP